MTSLTVEVWRAAVARGDTTEGFHVWKAACEIKMEEEARLKAANFQNHRFSQYEMASISAGLEMLRTVKERGIQAVTVSRSKEIIGMASEWDGTFEPLNDEQLADLIERMQSDNTLVPAEEKPVLGYLYKQGLRTVTIGTKKPDMSKCKLTVIELVAK